MTKYTITRECGHQETVNIGGPQKDRARQEEYEARKLCTACYYGQQQAVLQAVHQQAVAANAEAGLPTLEGSEQQVAWAEDIRFEMLAGAAELEASITANAPDEAQKALALNALNSIRAQAQAGWWIARRSLCLMDLLRNAARS